MKYIAVRHKQVKAWALSLDLLEKRGYLNNPNYEIYSQMPKDVTK